MEKACLAVVGEKKWSMSKGRTSPFHIAPTLVIIFIDFLLYNLCPGFSILFIIILLLTACESSIAREFT